KDQGKGGGHRDDAAGQYDRDDPGRAGQAWRLDRGGNPEMTPLRRGSGGPALRSSERSRVRFLLDGEVIEVADPDPTATVLDYLRYTLRRTGTKEGCAEGDCGACTVVLGALEDDAVRWRAVNACILFLPMLDGKALRT